MQVHVYETANQACRAAAFLFASQLTRKPDSVLGLATGSTPVPCYQAFMDENLFNRVNIRREAVHLPDASRAGGDEAGIAYDAAIEAAGGIDLQLLGIGQNGHIGFNEPADAFTYGTHIVDLAENTIHANARFFDSEDDVPRKAISMGIGNIMACRSVVLIATGANKADAVYKSVYGPVDPHVPASILRTHPSALFLLDKEAASLLK